MSAVNTHEALVPQGTLAVKTLPESRERVQSDAIARGAAWELPDDGPDAFEQTLFAAADIFGFDLAWECLQGSPVAAGEADEVLDDVNLFAVHAAPERPDGEPLDGVPLDEWLISQAAWWRSKLESEDAQESMLLVAGAIETAAQACRFHRCASVSELVSRSARYRRCGLDAIATPDSRPRSTLAAELDSAVEDYLVSARPGEEPGIASRLLAWAILDVANEAEYFMADSVDEYTEAKAAYESAMVDAVLEGRDELPWN